MHVCAYQGVRNVSFSKNFAHIIRFSDVFRGVQKWNIGLKWVKTFTIPIALKD